MSSTAIRTTGLTRRFGALTAVSGLDLEVPAGAIYGFLGPNGAGKTTTIRMLLGLIRPDAGEVELLGIPLAGRRREALRRTGALSVALENRNPSRSSAAHTSAASLAGESSYSVGRPGATD